MFIFIPAVCEGFIPIPSSVMIADVVGSTLNSSAANFNTAVNGVFSGTLNLQVNRYLIWLYYIYIIRYIHILTYTLNGSLGSEVKVILKVTLALKRHDYKLKLEWIQKHIVASLMTKKLCKVMIIEWYFKS